MNGLADIAGMRLSVDAFFLESSYVFVRQS